MYPSFGPGRGHPQLRLIAAHSLLAQGLQQRGKQEAQQVLRLDPGQAEAHRLLADIAQAEGQVGTACEHLQCVLELAPADEHARTVHETLSRWAVGPSGVGQTSDKGGVSQLSLRVTSIARFVEGFDQPDLVDVDSGDSGTQQISDSMLEELSPQKISDAAEPTPTPTPTPTRIDAESRLLFDSSRDLEAAADERQGGWEPGAVADASSGADPSFVQTLGLPAVGDDDAAARTDVPRGSASEGGDLPSPHDRGAVGAERGIASSPFEPLSPLETGEPPSDELDNEPTRIGGGRPGAGRPESGEAMPRLDAGGLQAISEDRFDEFELEPAGAPETPQVPAAFGPAAFGPAAFGPAATEPAADQPLSPSIDPLAATAPPDESAEAAVDDGSFDSADDSGQLATDSMMHMLTGAGAPVVQGSPGASAPGGMGETWDPLAEAPAASEAPLGFSHPAGQGALEPPDSLEQELMAAGVAEPPPQAKRGKLRIILALVMSFVIGAGGLYAFLVYRNYAYVKSEWSEVRAGLHDSTLAGLGRAMAAAKRVLAKNPNNKEAVAAVGMCDAAAAFELGEDRLAQAKKSLEQSKGSDSQWRSAAGAYLALMEDPAVAVGYSKMGAEVYEDSALLRYLHGRALAFAGDTDATLEAYRAALKMQPDFAAAQVSLADHIGRQSGGLQRSLELYDALLEKRPNHVQALLARARLRTEHGTQLEEALADAQRVTNELKEQASGGQRGWASLIATKVARSKGDIKAMSSALDAAIASPPCCDDGFSYEVAGELQSLFRYSDALAQMRRALAHKPKYPPYLRRIGRILLALGQPKEAEPYILAAPPLEPQTQLLKGQLAFEFGRFREAETSLRAAARHSATELEAQIYLALVRARLGERSSAVAALRGLRARHPRADVVPQALGRVYLWGGDYGSAEAALKAAWQLNALDPLTPTLLGYVSMARQDTVRARKRFERALQEQPKYALAHIGLAELMRRGRNLGAARAEAEKVAQADRKRVEYRALEARLALAEGRTEAAEAALSVIKEAGAPALVVKRISGQLALAQGKARLAADLLLQAHKADPRDVELAVLTGRALLKARRTDQAYDQLEAVLKLDPGHPEALLELARISVADGEYQFGIQRMAKALTQMRARQWPKKSQAEVFTALGGTFLARNDTGRALTNFQDAIDLDPTAALPHHLMGRTYARLDRPSRAVPYYRKAIELDPNFPPSFLALGESLAAAGDKSGALTQLKAFVAKSKNRRSLKRARQLIARLQ